MVKPCLSIRKAEEICLWPASSQYGKLRHQACHLLRLAIAVMPGTAAPESGARAGARSDSLTIR